MLVSRRWLVGRPGLVVGLLAGNGHIHASPSVKVDIKSRGQECNKKESTEDLLQGKWPKRSGGDLAASTYVINELISRYGEREAIR